MEEENYQQQQDELCALEAIYADNFHKYSFCVLIHTIIELM